MSDRLTGPVEIVGAGLLGTSIGLACRRAGIEVLLSDTAAEHLRTASRPGRRARAARRRPAAAGRRRRAARTTSAPRSSRALRRTDAVVTDVGSVKSGPLRAAVEAAARAGGAVRRRPPDGRQRALRPAGGERRAVRRPALGGHPARRVGTERGGAGRGAGRALLRRASRCALDPEEHDRAVARISHLPHLLAVLVAGRLAGRPARSTWRCPGQGVRDVTRVAGRRPGAVAADRDAQRRGAARACSARSASELDALDAAVADGDRDASRALLARGVAGTQAIPGKHGGPVRADPRRCSSRCPTTPASWRGCSPTRARAGVNIEDVHIDHDPGRPSASSSWWSTRRAPSTCSASLESRGWVTHR